MFFFIPESDRFLSEIKKIYFHLLQKNGWLSSAGILLLLKHELACLQHPPCSESWRNRMSLFCSTENHLLNPLQTAREWIQSVCTNGSFVLSLEKLGFKPLTSKRKWKLLACFGGFASLGPCSGQTSVDSEVLLVVFVSWWVVERISFVLFSSETRSTSGCRNKR